MKDTKEKTAINIGNTINLNPDVSVNGNGEASDNYVDVVLDNQTESVDTDSDDQNVTHPVTYRKSERELTFEYYDHNKKQVLRKVLTHEIELELIKIVKDLQIPDYYRKEAMHRLVQAYDSYIKSILKKNYKYSGVSKDDLYSHALIGFMEAVENFDENKSNNARLMTYAYNHIKKNIVKLVNKLAYPTKSITTKDASLAKTQLQKIKAERDLVPEDYENIAKNLNNKTADYVRGIESSLTKAKSLDDVDENGNSFGNTIEDSDSNFYEEIVENDEATKIRIAFFEAFNNILNEREQYIVKHRIAKDYFEEIKEKATLSQLAEHFNISTERVRQIENKAKEKLQQALSMFRETD